MTQQELLNDLRRTAHTLTQNYNYTKEQLLTLLQTQTCIPATIFSNNLSPLQALVTYLHDHEKETFPDIAQQIHRSYRAVWGAYQQHNMTITYTKYTIPISCFDDKKSVLETTVHYLRTHYNLKFTDIALLLDKDPRTIWTVWNRAEKKDGTTS